MMRQLKITRDTAVKARTTAMNTLKQIVVHAPPALREALHPSPTTACSRAAPDSDRAHRHAHRVRQTYPPGARPPLDGSHRGNVRYTTSHLARLTTETSPTLREGFGVGAHTAAELLIVFGDNPDRIRSEAAFAKLCGACPHPGLVRDDHRPAPPQSRRPPTRQRRPLSGRHRPHAVPSADR